MKFLKSDIEAIRETYPNLNSDGVIVGDAAEHLSQRYIDHSKTNEHKVDSESYWTYLALAVVGGSDETNNVHITTDENHPRLGKVQSTFDAIIEVALTFDPNVHHSVNGPELHLTCDNGCPILISTWVAANGRLVYMEEVDETEKPTTYTPRETVQVHLMGWIEGIEASLNEAEQALIDFYGI